MWNLPVESFRSGWKKQNRLRWDFCPDFWQKKEISQKEEVTDTFRSAALVLFAGLMGEYFMLSG